MYVYGQLSAIKDLYILYRSFGTAWSDHQTTGNDRKRKSTWTSYHKEQDRSAIVVTW